MADTTGVKKTKRKKSRKLRYFYLNGKLHKSLHINRGGDMIIAWSYPDAKRVGYTYSDVRRNMETAFKTREVCKMINRSSNIVEAVITDGKIEEPQFTYGLSETKRKYQYMWHEKNIMELHAHFSSVHTGRPRKDGLITTTRLPSARELRAMVRNQPVMGYLDEDGNFTPTWLAEDL